jgi:hypothetical protein
VVAGLAPSGEVAAIDAMQLVRAEKTLKGTYYGSARPQIDMPAMIELYPRCDHALLEPSLSGSPSCFGPHEMRALAASEWASGKELAPNRRTFE